MERSGERDPGGGRKVLLRPPVVELFRGGAGTGRMCHLETGAGKPEAQGTPWPTTSA
jgi:hypothetical protein